MPSILDHPGLWWRAMPAYVVALFALVACSHATPQAPPEQATVVASHSQGETVVPLRPNRIIALSTSWADAVLAFEIAPVGVGMLAGYAPSDGRFPWQGDYRSAPITLSLFGDPDFEAIAATDPDLILADFSARDDRIYERLSQIAPTIAPLRADGYVDSWRDQALMLGQILGESDSAQEMITSVDATLDETHKQFPCLDKATFVLTTLTPDAAGVVADPHDPAAELFAELGMTLLPEVTALAQGKSRLNIPYEQTTALSNADLIMLRDRGRSALPVSPTGQVAVMDGPVATALSDPSIRNISYVLNNLEPVFRVMCKL